MFIKIVKFCLVGASGMVLDFTITYLLKEKIKVHRYAANASGFMCAASSNFLLNRYWTFESLNPDVYREYALFITFALVGLIINTSCLIFFERNNFHFYTSKFLAIMVTTIWNFSANYFITFNG